MDTLVSLAEVQDWLDVTAGNEKRDAILARLINQTSDRLLSLLSRQSLLPRRVTDYMSGNGNSRVQLEEWPATSIISIVANGNPIKPRTSSTTTGWWMDQWRPGTPGNRQNVWFSDSIGRGVMNIQVDYIAGYQVIEEAAVVPLTAPYVVQARESYGNWATDEGVTDPFGQSLPVTPSVVRGRYTFDSSLAGQAILLNYGYVPFDITAGLLEWIAEIWNIRDRPGMTSRSIGGGSQSGSFARDEIPDFVIRNLRNYLRVA